MTSGVDLVSYLERNPFCSLSFLQRLFGREGLTLLLAQAGNLVRPVPVCGGSYYALQGEPDGLLQSLRRLERVRDVVCDRLGSLAVRGGLSPGWNADLELLWQDRWWRFWVDPGGCAVESLGFLQRNPPPAGQGVTDVILAADRERLAPLVDLLHRAWVHRRVLLLHPETGSVRTTQAAETRYDPAWKPPGPEQVAEWVSRRNQGVRSNRLGQAAAGLERADWDLLVSAGDLPLLTRKELAYVHHDRLDHFRACCQRLSELEHQGLLETALSPRAGDRLEERKVLSSLGLDLLAGHWGCTPEELLRKQPWPLACDRRGHLTYRLRWLDVFGAHYDLVRQVSLALLAGSRGVSTETGGVRIRLRTTIAGRMTFVGRTHSWVQPDAVLTAEMYRRGWLDGISSQAEHPGAHGTLLLEVDRGTMATGRLEEKLDRYQQLWPQRQDRFPQLVWVVDGSPHREAWLLDAMRARGLTGWTVLLERLALPRHHSFWLRSVPVSLERLPRVALPYESTGGLAPWCPVWSGTAASGYGPLLGQQPWSDRSFSRTVRQPD